MNDENLLKHQSSESKIKNIEGMKFGMLTAIEWVGFTEAKPRKSIWKCKCDCGNYKNVRYDVLVKGKSSCGCISNRGTLSHNMCNSGAYRSWSHMIQRCENPNDPRYNCYGGRGIKVCDEWHNAKTFLDWAIDNGWEEGLTIERINVNGNYEPSNCCWIPAKDQYKNKQSNWMDFQDGRRSTQSLYRIVQFGL